MGVKYFYITAVIGGTEALRGLNLYQSGTLVYNASTVSGMLTDLAVGDVFTVAYFSSAAEAFLTGGVQDSWCSLVKMSN